MVPCVLLWIGPGSFVPGPCDSLSSAIIHILEPEDQILLSYKKAEQLLFNFYTKCFFLFISSPYATYVSSSSDFGWLLGTGSDILYCPLCVCSYWQEDLVNLPALGENIREQ